MATKRNNAVGQTAPAPASAPATGSITLPEMPPAETFVGLVAYGVDTVTDESKHIPLEFLASGVQACINATAASIEQTAAAEAATKEAATAKQGADEAAGTARNEASNLSALKEAVADATADSIKKTKAAETATGAANTATTNANEATADAIEKTEAAQTAAEEANAAKDAAIEATENLTGEVSALVLTEANRPRIQELAGIDYSNTTEQLVPGEFWPDSVTGQPKQVYRRVFKGTTPTTQGGGGVGVGSNYDQMSVVLASITYDAVVNNIPYRQVMNIVGGSTYSFTLNINHGSIVHAGFPVDMRKSPYLYVIKYTKING